MAKRARTSLTLPLTDARLIQAALTDAGATKLRALGDLGTQGGAGSVELQLANQLRKRIDAIEEGNTALEMDAVNITEHRQELDLNPPSTPFAGSRG